MPYLSKRVISNYFRTDCPRQLALMLYPHNKQYEPVRSALEMPPKAVGRTGMNALTEEGGRWEQAKLHDLEVTFGGQAVLGVKVKNDYQDQKLSTIIARAFPGMFLVRPEFTVGETFTRALTIDEMSTTYELAFANLIPDLIQVIAPDDIERIVQADGTVHPADGRVGLRVIDIKMTAEPSASYFAEITYYSLALAGWLQDQGFADRFAVVAEAAIWPGSHDAAEIVKLQAARREEGSQASDAELRAALKIDIETLEIEVFAPRLRYFFNVELRAALQKPWRSQDYHVSTACSGCEYLGYSWNPDVKPHAEHCIPRAEADGHLSSIAFLPRGARRALGDRAVIQAETLAGLSADDEAFDCHPRLRAARTVVAGRAQALASKVSSIPLGSGTSAVLPSWSDLSLYLSADFDVGSGLTLAFGIAGFSKINGEVERVEAQVFVNDTRSIESERRELLSFLSYLNKALSAALKADPKATVQIYIWDSVTYEHLIRVIGRNLQYIMADSNLKKLAWLFPADELIENANYRSANAPITIVRNAVQALVAAPIPHYYSLLALAREFRPPIRPGNTPFEFRVPTIFEDPLSDQVPSERAHEIWTRMGAPRPWSQQVSQLRSTVTTKLRATASIVNRLRLELKGALRSRSPKIADIKAPSMLDKVSADGQVWFAYAKLNAQVAALEQTITMATPVHEREARYLAARLERELVGTEASQAATSLGVARAPGVRIYRLGQHSLEAKFEAGDFLCALSPASMGDFHMKQVRDVTGGQPLPSAIKSPYLYATSLTKAAVLAIDRDKRCIAVYLDPEIDDFLRSIERDLDLSQDVVLDKLVTDFLTKRLEKALKAIGNPPLAVTAGVSTLQVLGKSAVKKVSASVPVEDVLWDTVVVAQTPTERSVGRIRPRLEGYGVKLNDSQWDALRQAVEQRLALIWGPPGTGKSETLRAILLGLLVDSQQTDNPIRILVTSNTYDATDNVVVKGFKKILALGTQETGAVQLVRLRSGAKAASKDLAPEIDLLNDQSDPKVRELHATLRAKLCSVIVSAPPQQVTKFAAVSGNAAEPLFDVVLIDEASQMDMANAVLALAPIAAKGSVIVVGDPKQLPPIQQVEPPVGLEKLVGSVYDFMADHRGVKPVSLLENYRSNSAIVGFSRFAGYPAQLSAFFPDLRIATDVPLPKLRPRDWPQSIEFAEELAALLDPTQPISAFIYPEGRSSQWNDFEAQTVAALLVLLRRHLMKDLANLPDAGGSGLHDAESFWKSGVGVVTPHRAHKALVVSRLQALFGPIGDDAQLIRDAVNTVERFQGQQRDVIIASYALGDPDAIADEDEFLLSLNRFNVMSSRPRAKLIVLASQEVINHLPSDIKIMRDSRLLKYFAETFLDSRTDISIPYQEGNGIVHRRQGSFRCKQPQS